MVCFNDLGDSKYFFIPKSNHLLTYDVFSRTDFIVLQKLINNIYRRYYILI